VHMAVLKPVTQEEASCFFIPVRFHSDPDPDREQAHLRARGEVAKLEI